MRRRSQRTPKSLSRLNQRSLCPTWRTTKRTWSTSSSSPGLPRYGFKVFIKRTILNNKISFSDPINLSILPQVGVLAEASWHQVSGKTSGPHFLGSSTILVLCVCDPVRNSLHGSNICELCMQHWCCRAAAGCWDSAESTAASSLHPSIHVSTPIGNYFINWDFSY